MLDSSRSGRSGLRNLREAENMREEEEEEEEEEGEEMRRKRKEEVTKGAASASGRRRDARTRRSIDPRLGGLGVNLISWSSLSLNDQQLLFLESTIFDRHYFREALSWINL